jgi:hypothetical protein
MIPTVICRAYSLQDQVDALAIVVAACLVGWAGARLPGKVWAWGCLLLAIFTPVAPWFGVWPFDARWKDNCGFTPDPSILTLGATMLFPLLLGGAYLTSNWSKRAKPVPRRDVA